MNKYKYGIIMRILAGLSALAGGIFMIGRKKDKTRQNIEKESIEDFNSLKQFVVQNKEI